MNHSFTICIKMVSGNMIPNLMDLTVTHMAVSIMVVVAEAMVVKVIVEV